MHFVDSRCYVVLVLTFQVLTLFVKGFCFTSGFSVLLQFSHSQTHVFPAVRSFSLQAKEVVRRVPSHLHHILQLRLKQRADTGRHD